MYMNVYSLLLNGRMLLHKSVNHTKAPVATKYMTIRNNFICFMNMSADLKINKRSNYLIMFFFANVHMFCKDHCWSYSPIILDNSNVYLTCISGLEIL